jgi:hypothetical protein
MQSRKQSFFAILLGMSIGIALFTIGYARTKHAKQDPPQQKELITSVPEIISCVKNIKVINKEIKNAGRPDATIEVEVENTCDLGIIAISLESAKGRETYGVLSSTFEADEPIAIIKPHDTYILTIAASNVFPDVPLQIGSIMYIDGTAEGCSTSLKNMRDSKAMHEAQRAKRKGSPQ